MSQDQAAAKVDTPQLEKLGADRDCEEGLGPGTAALDGMSKVCNRTGSQIWAWKSLLVENEKKKKKEEILTTETSALKKDPLWLLLVCCFC